MTSPRAVQSEQNLPQRSLLLGMIGWIVYDWATNSFPTIVETFLFASYFTGEVAPSETAGTTWWGLTLGITGLLIAVAAPLLGALLDQLGRRKPWIAVLTSVTVVAVALMWFIEPEPGYALPALLLLAVGTFSLQLALVLYNAMLPALAPPEKTGRWSGWGWCAGYAGGLACLAVALFVFVLPEGGWLGLDPDRAEHIRATLPMTAVWLLLFTLPLLWLTPDAPSSGKPLGRAARDALGQLRDSFRALRRYQHIVRFLIARLFYVEGLTTVFIFGGVYARGTFGMDAAEILAFGIGMNIAAGLGALAFSWIDDWIGGKRTVTISLVGLMVPGTALLLVQSTFWFWVFALLLGVFVGPAQAGSRSYLARVAPEKLHNQLFGLYAFSGKAVAFLGPLLVGGLTHLTQSQRIGMSAVVGLIFLGFLVWLTVPREDQVAK
jgi:MFS transporter, UMF1 family